MGDALQLINPYVFHQPFTEALLLFLQTDLINVYWLVLLILQCDPIWKSHAYMYFRFIELCADDNYVVKLL